MEGEEGRGEERDVPFSTAERAVSTSCVRTVRFSSSAGGGSLERVLDVNVHLYVKLDASAKAGRVA